MFSSALCGVILTMSLNITFGKEDGSSDTLMIYGSPRNVQGIYVCDGEPTTCQHPHRFDPTQPITPGGPGTVS